MQNKTWITPTTINYNLYLDCLKQQHLLVAGASGSGKSVFIHGLIHGILTSAPCENSMIIIDLKKVELYRYNNTPHCIRFCSTHSEALQALCAANDIIDSRIEIMLKNGLVNWNKTRVYIIIDELAELTDGKQGKAIKEQIKRIGRLGRAAGVWLICATQDPSRKTLPADITLNFSAQVALRCRSAIESRQITGFGGAETLPRYGECYYMRPGDLNPKQYIVHMYTDQEIINLIYWWTKRKSFR